LPVVLDRALARETGWWLLLQVARFGLLFAFLGLLLVRLFSYAKAGVLSIIGRHQAAGLWLSYSPGNFGVAPGGAFAGLDQMF